MEVYPNNETGRYFLHIQDVGMNKRILVTPTGAVKAVENQLFGEPVSGEEDFLLSGGLITREQLEAYKTYRRSRDDEQVERWELIIEEMPPWQRERLIEALKTRSANSRDATKEVSDAGH